MRFFTVYKKVPVNSDGTIIEQRGGLVELIVEEYNENGIVDNEVKYASVDEKYLLGKIVEEHPAGEWENFDW